MEFFDIVDEKGIPTGESIERTQAHKKGIRHRTAHIWIIREQDGKAQLLLQKRSAEKDSFPGRFDTSSAGHIQAGDEPEESAIRELYEELGIQASKEELQFAGCFDIQYEKEFHGKMFRDNEVAFVYMYTKPVDVAKLILQKEEVESVEWFDMEELDAAFRPNTKAVFGETIANPLMSVPDIRHLADVAHANGAKLFIDNTFATSIIAKPIKYGADLVIYSATKYLGGHDDLVGGAVVGSEEIIKSLSFYLGLYGANLGATESWLLARSLRTLPLRVKKMAENGLALAKFFESHPKVEKVYYPGLESSPSKALADKQFEGNGYGGMLCVNFKGGQKEIDKLISNLQLVRFVPTLAGVGTTLTYPPRASHRDLSPDELAAIGITMGQIRLSSGLEDTDDLLNDFDQALAKM